MTHRTVPLVRFNSRSIAERAARMLESEGMSPSLVFGQITGHTG
jgi:hypothetical protein